MSHSVFTGILMPKKEILFVKRRDKKGSWYLPGGKIPEGSSLAMTQQDWGGKLFEWTGDTSFGYMGYWNLSEEVGGFDVHLFRSVPAYPDTVQVYKGSDNEYVQEAKPFSLELIKYHLYETRLLPWGQAKMAVSLLQVSDFSEALGKTHHGLLKDDLGIVNDYDWHRPWVLSL